MGDYENHPNEWHKVVFPVNRPDWVDSNGFCKECAYPVCTEIYQGYACPFHEQDHEQYHDAWSRAVGSDLLNGPMTATEISNRSSYRPFPLKSCASCEEPINETSHACKAVDASVEWLDVMRKLK